MYTEPIDVMNSYMCHKLIWRGRMPSRPLHIHVTNSYMSRTHICHEPTNSYICRKLIYVANWYMSRSLINLTNSHVRHERICLWESHPLRPDRMYVANSILCHELISVTNSHTHTCHKPIYVTNSYMSRRSMHSTNSHVRHELICLWGYSFYVASSYVCHEMHMFVTNCAGGEGHLQLTNMSRTEFLVANSILCHELIQLSRTHVFVTNCAGGEGHFYGCSTGAQLPQIRARCDKTVFFLGFLPQMKLPYVSRTYLSRTYMWCCFQILPQMCCAFACTKCDMSRTHITNSICHELNLSRSHVTNSYILVSVGQCTLVVHPLTRRLWWCSSSWQYIWIIVTNSGHELIYIGFCRTMHYRRASAHTTTLMMLEFVTYTDESLSRTHVTNSYI